jgi:hypothetical protein
LQVLAAVRRGDWIDAASFLTICKVLGVSDDVDQVADVFDNLHAADNDSDRQNEISA